MIMADPGSFRDPASRIVLENERVIRLLDSRGLEAWKQVAAAPFFRKAVAEEKVITSSPATTPPGDAAAALEHPRLPLIT